jgi:hypothetical protein
MQYLIIFVSFYVRDFSFVTVRSMVTPKYSYAHYSYVISVKCHKKFIFYTLIRCEPVFIFLSVRPAVTFIIMLWYSGHGINLNEHFAGHLYN